VCLHNRWLGEQFPEAVQHTVFGDPLYNTLSPAHPLVREYLLTHVTDLASQFDLHAIMLESPGYMGFQHGEHHEIIGTEFDPVQRDMLNLSFSDVEIEGAIEAGIPADVLRGLTAAVLDASINQGVKLAREDGTPTSVVSQLVNSGLTEYMVWMKQQELSLAAEVRDAVKAINPNTRIWHFAALDGTPGDAALIATGDGTLAGYADSGEEAERRAHDAAQLGRPVRGAIRAIAPDTTSPGRGGGHRRVQLRADERCDLGRGKEGLRLGDRAGIDPYISGSVAIWIRLPQVSSNTAVSTGPILTGSCVKRTPSAVRRSCSAKTSSTANWAAGIPSATRAALYACAAGW
jgi:hypothetical protein